MVHEHPCDYIGSINKLYAREDGYELLCLGPLPWPPNNTDVKTLARCDSSSEAIERMTHIMFYEPNPRRRLVLADESGAILWGERVPSSWNLLNSVAFSSIAGASS